MVAFAWPMALTTTPLITGGLVSGGGVITVAGRISMLARFHMSLVGAVSLMVTGMRLPPVLGAVCRCTQNVSPTGARYSSALVWFAPTVRATARLQSLPTPHVQEPAAVVVRLAVGAPVAALVEAVAPLVVVLAPLNDTTVIEPTQDPLERVAVTIALASGDGRALAGRRTVPAGQRNGDGDTF